MLSKVIFTFLAVVFLTLGGTTMAAAETQNVSGAEGQYGFRHEGENGGSSAFCNLNSGDLGLTEDESSSILFMREEEKVARDSYMVLGGLWGLTVFDNISASEQNHMDAVKALITCYGLVDPVIDEVGSFTNPELQALFDFLMDNGQKSPMDGLYVGALIEETDIVDIEESIELTATDHENIVSTYQSIMCGSRNHLRAYMRQIENNGGSYAPTVLEPEEFWGIVDSPMERDCGDY